MSDPKLVVTDTALFVAPEQGTEPVIEVSLTTVVGEADKLPNFIVPPVKPVPVIVKISPGASEVEESAEAKAARFEEKSEGGDDKGRRSRGGAAGGPAKRRPTSAGAGRKPAGK